MAAPPKTETGEHTTAPPIDSHTAPVADRGNKSGRATAAMILAIVGLPVAVFFPIGGFILGILGIVFGANARMEAARQGFTNRGQALAGIILGTIDLLVAAAIVAIVAANHS